MTKIKKRSSFAKTKKAGQVKALPALIKLDVGCGPNKQPGFVGMDVLPFDGKVDIVHDIRKGPWPIKSGSVEEIHCSHVLEHLTNLDDRWERVLLFNEMYRVLAPGGKVTLIFPDWASSRYYGDPTHKEPFSAQMGFMYLNREWRLSQAPHTDAKYNKGLYDCNFQVTWAVSLHPDIAIRNGEQQQYAMQWYKEAIMDVIATMVKQP